MKIVVLGANGRTGRHVVQFALDRGHDVIAIVRSDDKRPEMKHDRMEVLVGDPCCPKFLARAIQQQDVVISTLGGRAPTKAATAIYYKSAEAIVVATRHGDLKRVLVTSSALLFPPQSVLNKILQLIIRRPALSATRMELVLKNSALEWTIARCGFLTDADEDRYRAEKGQLPENGSSISRKGLANFLLDATEQTNAVAQVFGVARPAGKLE